MQPEGYLAIAILLSPIVGGIVYMFFDLRRLNQAIAEGKRMEEEARKTAPYWEAKRKAAQELVDEADQHLSEIASKEDYIVT